MKRSSRHSKERKLIPWFLSLLFCMLNGSSLFFCGMCFTVVIIFLTTNRDVSSFVVLVFISLLSNLIISFYILIRELLYKLIHCLGYRAQPDLKVLHMSVNNNAFLAVDIAYYQISRLSADTGKFD